MKKKIILIICGIFILNIFILAVRVESDTLLLKINLAVPQNTPESTSIYIVGNIPEFGSWQHSTKLTRISKKTAELQLPISIPVDNTLEYKYTLGSWNTVEKTKNGIEAENRKVKLNYEVDKEKIVDDIVGSWASLANPILKNTLTGNIKLHENFHSPELNNDRNIIVYLPPDYGKNKEKKYPVLYMHDGNNIFDIKTSFAGFEWKVDENAEKLIKSNYIKSVIIVGIYNNSDRADEYTPFKDSKHGGGNGEKYLEFIVNTVKPFIDKEYRTLPDRDNTTIAGSSLGGLISLYAVFKYQDTFGAAGVISPALWWADLKIIDYVKNAKAEKTLKMWIDIGTDEGEKTGALQKFNEAVEDCKSLNNVLKTKSKTEPIKFSYNVIKGAKHNEKAWSERIGRILQFFYKRK